MIIKLEKIDSTNRYALREFAKFADNTLIIADTQDAGRGRRGKSWFSPPCLNIYASYILKKTDFPAFKSLWICGLAGLKTLRFFVPDCDLWLKWPNDIYCTPKRNPALKLKIAGLLAETYSPAKSNTITGIVAGMGINLNMQQEDIAKIDKPATSLFLETGQITDIARFADILWENLKYFRSLAEKEEESFFNKWQQENRLLHKNVTIKQDNDVVLSGKINAFSRCGEMILCTEDGKLHTIMTGELENF